MWIKVAKSLVHFCNVELRVNCNPRWYWCHEPNSHRIKPVGWCFQDSAFSGICWFLSSCYTKWKNLQPTLLILPRLATANSAGMEFSSHTGCEWYCNHSAYASMSLQSRWLCLVITLILCLRRILCVYYWYTVKNAQKAFTRLAVPQTCLMYVCLRRALIAWWSSPSLPAHS